MKDDMLKEIEIPEKVTIKIGSTIKISGPQGEVEKKLFHPKVKISLEKNRIILKVSKGTKREKKVINSFRVHLKNMIQGVVKKHLYKLKICSGHFPMSVSVAHNQFIIKNFLGESVPRKVNIKPGAEVKIEGTEITVISANKETAGQVAADIEQLTKIKKRDPRNFQDGCYITQKAGKDM